MALARPPTPRHGATVAEQLHRPRLAGQQRTAGRGLSGGESVSEVTVFDPNVSTVGTVLPVGGSAQQQQVVRDSAI